MPLQQCAIIVTLAMTQLAIHAHTAPAKEWPAPFQMDANLYDVFFVNNQTGWSVGDRGTILKTVDGGTSWHLQTTPVTCRLESVFFLDEFNGWAVGGYSVPYTHRAIGVVLRTTDGGATWVEKTTDFLPWLTKVVFLDDKRGFLTARPTAMFPSAVFRTEDSGKHWTPMPGVTTGGNDICFAPNGEGLLIERTGRVTRVTRQGLKSLTTSPLGSALPKRLHMASSQHGFVCGNQGRFAGTSDGGKTWIKPAQLPTEQWLSEYDWLAITGVNQHLWIGGAPGSHLLHSRDGGRTWEVQRTNQMLPLFDLHFVDAQHGWAVGALGTILSTRDGGLTWDRQSDNPQRLGVMVVASQVDRVPWEFLAQVAGGEGFLSGVEILSGPRPNAHQTGTVSIASRLHDATIAVGGSGANVIQSLPVIDSRLQLSAATISKEWDRALSTNSREQLSEYLVRQIRLYQPEMIVIGDDPRTDEGGFKLIESLVRNAIDRATDQQSYPNQLQSGGLKPWQVQQITTLGTNDDRSYRVMSNRMVLPLGQTNSTLAAKARSLLNQKYRQSPAELLFEITGNHGLAGNRRERVRLFHASTLAEGSRMQRQDLTINDQFKQLHQQAQRRRTIEMLLSSQDENSQQRLQRINQMLTDLSESDRGDLMYQAATRLEMSGQTAAAYALFDQLSEMADHPLSESARLKKFIRLASQEGRLHWKLPHENEVQHLATSVLQLPRPQTGVRQATFEQINEPDANPPESLEETDELRSQEALKAAKSIQLQQPDLYFEPMLRFPLASLYKRVGRGSEAERFWRNQLANQTDLKWKQIAASEIALLRNEKGNKGTQPICRLTKTPPYLDGELKDEVWKNVAAIQLQSQQSGKHLKTEMKWAWDKNFLYLSAKCERNAKSLTSSHPQETRQRDADLSDQDRLEIQLDIDRDYQTHWKITIDQRGWAIDALNDDISWNPTWYIAAHDHAAGWSLEAAIPWDQISPSIPNPGQAWALGIERIIPGRDLQRWVPADGIPNSQGQGLIIFK